MLFFLQICLVNQPTSVMAISLVFNVIWLLYTFTSYTFMCIFIVTTHLKVQLFLSKIYICTFSWAHFVTTHLVYAHLHLDSFSKPYTLWMLFFFHNDLAIKFEFHLLTKSTSKLYVICNFEYLLLKTPFKITFCDYYFWLFYLTGNCCWT